MPTGSPHAVVVQGWMGEQAGKHASAVPATGPSAPKTQGSWAIWLASPTHLLHVGSDRVGHTHRRAAGACTAQHVQRSVWPAACTAVTLPSQHSRPCAGVHAPCPQAQAPLPALHMLPATLRTNPCAPWPLKPRVPHHRRRCGRQPGLSPGTSSLQGGSQPAQPQQSGSCSTLRPDPRLFGVGCAALP